MKHQAKAFTVTAKGGVLRELRTDCRIVAAFDPTRVPEKQHPKGTIFSALWDTGASSSAITQHVVDTCGLKPIGMTEVNTAGGTQQRETFLVNVLLPNGVGFAGLTVACVQVKNADVLLGMDIITAGDFSITNLGGATVAKHERRRKNKAKKSKARKRGKKRR